MIVHLHNLRAIPKGVCVTASAGPDAGLETFTLIVDGSVFLANIPFLPGEMKDVTIAHSLAGIHAPVEVSASGRTIAAMMALPGDDETPYPGDSVSTV